MVVIVLPMLRELCSSSSVLPLSAIEAEEHSLLHAQLAGIQPGRNIVQLSAGRQFQHGRPKWDTTPLHACPALSSLYTGTIGLANDGSDSHGETVRWRRGQMPPA